MTTEGRMERWCVVRFFGGVRRRSPTVGPAVRSRAPRTGPRGIGEFQGFTPLQGSFLKIATPQIEHFLYRYTSF
jgi:hypothetical protein